MNALQSRLSGMFFKDFGCWVGEAGEARSFDTAERARQFAAAERITDVFVVNTDGAEERIVPLPWPTLDAA
jgi:hypothetical protein